MEQNKQYNIGKIRTYDNYTGEIISQDGVFIFLNENISGTKELTINDVVMFRGEEIQGTKKAFFVQKLNPEKKLEEEVYKILKK